MDPQSEFRGVYDAHRTALHAYFLGRSADPGAAADLTQELFLRAWQHLPALLDRDHHGQRAWLFTVARNLVIDTGRRAAGRQRAEAAVFAEPAPVAPAASERAIAGDQLTIVADAVHALPDDLRLVLTMAAAGDQTSVEIGKALGIPAGTARYRLSKARAAVAAALTEDDHAASDSHHPERNPR